MQKMLLRILSLVLLVSFMVSPVVAQSPDRDPRAEGLGEPEKLEVEKVNHLQRVTGYIVLLEGDSLATYQGGISGLPATSPSVTDQEIDIQRPEIVRYLDYLENQQEMIIAEVESVLAREIDVKFRYDVILNGFAAEMSLEEAKTLEGLDGIRAVLPDEIWQPDTDVSPGFLGADTIWTDSPSTPGVLETKGEGMVIGVLDTGINLDHPSFADIGDDGYDHTNPLGAGTYLGLCDTDPTNFVCNDKLVGVYAYTQADETLYGEDANAHGSHTASTAAGNYLETEFNGIPVTISGMAPHANIISYDVCHADGCPNSYSVEAVEQAVLDGVDVLNYSIGPSSGAVNPYENGVELAMLEAVASGVLTSTSAGNSGPDASTVFKAPAWSLIVANSTHGRIFGNPVEVFETPGDVLYEAVALPGVGVSYTTDFTEFPIRWAGDDDPANFTGCSAFSTDFFSGSVALISRGVCAFADKINYAAAAGAEAVLVYNNSAGPPIVMGGIEATTVPSAMLDKEDGDAIVALMSGTLQTTIGSDQVAGTKAIWADILASGSSRGPFELLDILVPEVAAPGTNVLAAYNTPGATAPFGGVGSDTEIDLMSGTSMASPHGAGSALLLMDLFPEWTPIEIKSALIMSAYSESMLKDDGITPADPFDVGNGRIDLTKAALIGLVMDETVANFTDADPAAGGDVKTLNIPSYQNSQCVGECSFTRTVKNVADVATEYVVSVDAPEGVEVIVTPSTFTLDAGATRTVDFDIDVMSAELGTWQFGYVNFDTDGTFTTGEPITDARFPMAVMPDAGNLPALVEQDVYRDAGGVILEDLYSITINDMDIQTAGLTEADLFEFSLPGDPTNGDAFDNLDDVWYTTFTIPSGTKRVVMEILETSASDLDLFFGFGPTPSAGTLWEASATGAALEYISWVDPIPYQWWVLVQNWGGDPLVEDDVKLALGLVPDVPSTNFDVSGPASVPALTEFNLEVTWDVPEMEPSSAWYGWFSVGSDGLNPGNIGETELNVYRPYDDVTKEATVDYADVGDTVTYTIEIAPNRTDADLDYVIHDVLPEGVDYVDGTLNTVGSTTLATYDAVENAINWTGTVPFVEYDYLASTPATNPDYCDTPFGGGYLDLKTLDIYPISGLEGDSITWSFTSLGAGQEYYGEKIPTKPTFTSDGYFYMHPFDAWWDWIPQQFPDPTAPNGIVAPWMRDLVIEYELETRGVSAASWGEGVLWAIQFDDIVDWYSLEYPLDLPYNAMDFQVWSWRELDPAPGWPDLVFAYDNVVGDWDWNDGPWGTIGLENVDGTKGTTFAYDSYTPSTGDIICFDYTEANADPIVITFDVEVTATEPMVIKNSAMHTASGFAMLEEEAFAVFGANAEPPVADPQSLTMEEDTSLNITLTGSGLTPEPVTWVIATQPEYGTLSGTAPDLVYTPDADFYGFDEFTFYINDGVLDSNVATIQIEVTNINDPAIAMDDYYETNLETLLDVPAPGVLANDEDADPTDDVFVELRDAPSHGELLLNPDGSFTYMPDPGFFGVDSFTYYMLGVSEREYVDEATVYITVHPAVMIYFPLFQQ